MTKLLTHIRPGAVIEFMQGDQPQLAWVLEEQSGKLRIWTINKREMKLPANRVLPWYGPGYDPACSKQEIQDRLNDHQQRRGEIQASLNIMELWELAQGELEKAKLNWFTELLWTEAGPDHYAALGRAMLSAKAHFKFRPPYFEIYSAETVEMRLKLQAEEKEREAVVSAGQDLFKTLWDARTHGSSPSIPSMDVEVAERLQQLLRKNIAKQTDENDEKIWLAVRKGLPDVPHLALLLAQSWGILPPHYNYLLDEANYSWGDHWSKAHTEAIETQFSRFKKLEETPESIPFISIDGPTTNDIDDAFHVTRTENGYVLQLALARPVLAWDFDSSLDKDVFNRASSIYLPEGSTHMMPECLGTGLYSLFENKPRPALIAEFHLDETGEIISTTPRLSWVCVTKNQTYEAVETCLRSKTDAHLTLAHELASILIKKRIANGACIIRKPEPIVTVEEEGTKPQVRIELKESCPDAELIVSEFMILGNSGMALWAKEKGIPLLHRTQDIALPSDAAGIFTEPEEILPRVRLLLPANTEVQPKRHAALGVPAYTSITSPLRRYLDFINMAQVCTALEDGKPRLTTEELEVLLTRLSPRMAAVSQVQRFRPRYWKLLYLCQDRKAYRQAIVVDENGPLPNLAIPDLQINVRAPRKILGDKIYPGQRFQINFGRIDPLTNEIKVVEALEE